MKKFLPFIFFWALNTILLFLANSLSAANFVLGNARFSPIWAALVAGLVWTVLVWIAQPLVKKVGVDPKGAIGMLVFGWVSNFAAIWLTARMAPLTGLGISSFVWAILLALVADLAQFLLWKVGKFKD